ncbi:MAG: phage baseplate protein [Bacilli bacterium]
MKQTIGIGNIVDDGTGDYLRLGGEKINNNFNDLYAELGDGQVPYPAGAWKNHTAAALSPKFGQSFNLNTTTNQIRVTLPEGRPADYGRVIKLRDVWGTWSANPVIIEPSGTNTIKGGSTSSRLYRDLQDVELVFVSPGNWEYLNNKLVSRLSNSDGATVAKKEFIATQDQTDFIDVFGEAPYNTNNIEVYRRGNMLYYGDDFSAESDFGSVGTADAVVALDGRTIRLRAPCNAGDTITIVTYLDDLAVFKTSYVAKTIQVFDANYEGTLETDENKDQIFIGDLSKKKVWNLSDFGLTDTDGQMNPFSTEVQINGRNLVKAGTALLPAFICEKDTGADFSIVSESSCVADGGKWEESGIDFSVIKDQFDKFTQVKIQEPLKSGDMLTVKWYNNDIGSVMEWEEIKANADNFYLNNEYRFVRKNRIRYNDYADPNPCNVETIAEVETNIKFSDITSLLMSVYPVGSVYMNAHNKNNPAEYMGFGIWVPYAKGQSIVGWDDGSTAHFTNYTGDCGTVKSPGGSGGHVEHEIQQNEVPQVSSDDEVLIKDPNGDVLIGQCLLDPDDQGPGYRSYREDKLSSNVNKGGVNISLLQPFVTVAAWLRVG